MSPARPAYLRHDPPATPGAGGLSPRTEVRGGLCGGLADRTARSLPSHPGGQHLPFGVVLGRPTASAAVVRISAGLRRERMGQEAAHERLAGLDVPPQDLEVL